MTALQIREEETEMARVRNSIVREMNRRKALYVGRTVRLDMMKGWKTIGTGELALVIWREAAPLTRYRGKRKVINRGFESDRSDVELYEIRNGSKSKRRHRQMVGGKGR